MWCLCVKARHIQVLGLWRECILWSVVCVFLHFPSSLTSETKERWVDEVGWGLSQRERWYWVYTCVCDHQRSGDETLTTLPSCLLVILLFHGVLGNEIRVDVLVQSKHYCLIMINDNKVKLSNDEVLSWEASETVKYKVLDRPESVQGYWVTYHHVTCVRWPLHLVMIIPWAWSHIHWMMTWCSALLGVPACSAWEASSVSKPCPS